MVSNLSRIQDAVSELHRHGIRVSLFIDPDRAQIDAAKATGAEMIEIHTGAYADAADNQRNAELTKIIDSAQFGEQLELQVNAGHGLHYHNVQSVAAIEQVVELNIGHAIVARALFTGLGPATSEMKRLMVEARR